MHHLRSGEAREWSDFPEHAEAKGLLLRFEGSANEREQTLRLRQRDVKLLWQVRLNDKVLGPLTRDENDMQVCLPVPPGILRNGENQLRIECPAPAGPGTSVESDDVMVGDAALIDRPVAEALSEGTLEVTVTEGQRQTPVPCRITIVDDRGTLIALGTHSDAHLAVRTGVVYSGDGQAAVALPSGHYTVYGGRGFEYSVASTAVDVHLGKRATVRLSIARVVPTSGYVACDTHVHTFTYSRHGDATLDERMLTLAGEGIELPVATDHNLQIDYRKAASAMGVERYFTPIIGNEVTTASLGHFNVFPIAPESRLIDWRVHDWSALARHIARVAGAGEAHGPVVVLNHARDIHGGFRPFDPARHLAVIGEELDGQRVPANAMEVINSGSIQNDPMRLFRDWFGMLNRGDRLTPIGASDSHDVARYIVGQGRTYVRCNDADAGHIDVDEARRSLLAGRVLVSYGLLVDMRVNGRWESGDVAALERPAPGAPAEVDVDVRVLGPEWTRATHATLFANGTAIREADITTPPGSAEPGGVKWQHTWRIPRPRHDVWLVAIATGPGIAKPYWPTAKPYQPTSPDFTSQVIGSSGAIFVDADGSGGFDSAYDQAARVLANALNDPHAVIARLGDFDEAVAAQAAGILRLRLGERFEAASHEALVGAEPQVRRGFEAVLQEWRQAEKLRTPGTTRPASIP